MAFCPQVDCFRFDFGAVIERENIQAVERTHLQVFHCMENSLLSSRNKLLLKANLIGIVFLTKFDSVTLDTRPVIPGDQSTLQFRLNLHSGQDVVLGVLQVGDDRPDPGLSPTHRGTRTQF